jgi:hypothetical protein
MYKVLNEDGSDAGRTEMTYLEKFPGAERRQHGTGQED